MTDLELVWKQFEEFSINKDRYKEEILINNHCLCEDKSDQNLIIDEQNCTTVCDNCGLVLEANYISEQAEWRTFHDDNGFTDTGTGNRIGMPIDDLVPKSSMSTVIGAGNNRLKNLNMWISIPYQEKIIIDLKTKLNQIISIYQLPNSLVKSTLYLYKNFYKNDKSSYRGKNKIGILSVCFYYASKYHQQLNLSTTFISKCFEIDKTKFSKCCKIYNERIKINYDNTVIKSVDLLERYSNTIGLSFHIKNLAKNILKACENLNLFDNTTPQSLIAGIFYFISKEMTLKIELNLIASTCDISESTTIKVCNFLTTNKIKILNHVKENKEK